MIDPFGRKLTYLRVSVTDRCDFRCLYCMPEAMRFLPRDDLLSLEELRDLCDAFLRAGVQRLRITGGEPLMRRNVRWLFEQLGSRLGSGLEELTLTTNASQLAHHAGWLAACGVRRINVSLDSLDPARFSRITRRGRLDQVLAGLDAADAAGLAVKINTVALRGINEDEFDALIRWCGARAYDLCLIETMPMGDVQADRTEHYLPLSTVRARLARDWTLVPTDYATSGPARYATIAETGRRIGFITPMTHNFCESCNRVRLTCTGQLYMCLGQDDQADLRSVLRDGGDLDATIAEAITRKPRGHDFIIGRQTAAMQRHMSLTGG